MWPLGRETLVNTIKTLKTLKTIFRIWPLLGIRISEHFWVFFVIQFSCILFLNLFRKSVFLYVTLSLCPFFNCLIVGLHLCRCFMDSLSLFWCSIGTNCRYGSQVITCITDVITGITNVRYLQRNYLVVVRNMIWVTIAAINLEKSYSISPILKKTSNDI